MFWRERKEEKSLAETESFWANSKYLCNAACGQMFLSWKVDALAKMGLSDPKRASLLLPGWERLVKKKLLQQFWDFQFLLRQSLGFHFMSNLSFSFSIPFLLSPLGFQPQIFKLIAAKSRHWAKLPFNDKFGLFKPSNSCSGIQTLFTYIVGRTC